METGLTGGVLASSCVISPTVVTEPTNRLWPPSPGAYSQEFTKGGGKPGGMEVPQRRRAPAGVVPRSRRHVDKKNKQTTNTWLVWYVILQTINLTYGDGGGACTHVPPPLATPMSLASCGRPELHAEPIFCQDMVIVQVICTNSELHRCLNVYVVIHRRYAAHCSLISHAHYHTWRVTTVFYSYIPPI